VAREDEELEIPHPWDPPTAAVLGLVHVGALLAPGYFSWSGLILCLVLYVVTCLGITLGYHRLLTHRSYRAHRSLELALAALATLACQGGPVTWVAVHRLHHAKSDRPGDPHGAQHGFWWSHIGWMLTRPPHKIDPGLKERMAPDILRDPWLRRLDRFQLVWAGISALVLYGLGGWSWLLWGGCLRLVLTYHATWLVNSAAHLYGYRSHATADRSTNCWWVALLTFGEGWHNNHHAFPTSARHGLGPREWDVSYWILSIWQRLGWVSDLKVPRGTRRENLAAVC
jgi:stearoyl-CoA desaturase (delta-9 desaturase)